jgi:hypothetical protein
MGMVFLKSNSSTKLTKRFFANLYDDMLAACKAQGLTINDNGSKLEITWGNQ